MRNILYRLAQAIVLLAVAVSFAHADGIIKRRTAAAGASCSPSPTGDELTEGFENTSGGSGYESGYSAGVSGGLWTQTGSTIDNQAALTSAPTNSCSKGIQYNTSAATAYSLWNRYATIAANAAITYSAEFYIASWTLDVYTTARLMGFGATDIASDGTALSYVQLNNDGGQLQIRCNSIGGDPTTYVNITTEVWYRITTALDSAGGADASTCLLDTWNGSSWDAGTTYNYTRYVSGSARGTLVIGPYYAFGAGEAMNVTFGYVYLSTP